MREVLSGLLEDRFKEVPASAMKRIAAATTVELLEWVRRAASARTLASVFRERASQ